METVFQLVSNMLEAAKSQMLEKHFKSRKVIVTGGASFIGSNLVEMLVGFGAEVTVIDDFSSGRIGNIPINPSVQVIKGDLRYRDVAFLHVTDADICFHLAAVHGGRGFIETYKQEMLVNLAIDNNVFAAGVENGIKMMVHASSACAYPITLQENQFDRHLLEESEASMISPETSFADGVYGWTKLIGEFQLENHSRPGQMRGRSARIFTAYGERENESHAAVALIAKALLKADPFPIWGNGQQTRNFTYVSDTALGLLMLGADQSEKNYDVYNVGTSNHVNVIDFVSEIFKQLNWNPERIDFQLDRPTGVASRASNNMKINDSFGWEPRIGIGMGIQRTISWYSSLQNRPKTLFELEKKLSER